MINGVICINKEQNMTSHDVCFKLRKILGTKKVGHSGTLDPMATGVMGVLVGRSTKLSNYITGFDKEYVATMVFGKTSDSYDIWTEMEDVGIEDFSYNEFKDVINSFKGEIIQKPPIYSAIKVDGKPLYKYALEGKEVDIPSRKVYINDIEILRCNIPYSAEIKISCSKGTYVRSLINDIGRRLNTGAVMSSLVRTRNGVLNINDSFTIAEVEKKVKENKIGEILHNDDFFLKDLFRVDVNPLSSKIILNGNALIKKNILTDINGVEENTLLRLYLDDKFIGIGKRVEEDGVLIRPVKILYGE
ncbi:tRNA pseudouridine(55) synthase TruB [Anaerofustis sp.]|uniref:tRNA pseudouridine(55) synthase TruB n=1 Tax=Anaerofustis sp. TaxID=1872517 RepID=UPI0025B7DCA3|nr:tRNA pseudouridine(55) synthase TruB [Anaerofustis sp.]